MTLFSWLFKPPRNKYDFYSIDSKIGDPKGCGLSESDIGWQLSTPKLDKPETITLNASNASDETALFVQLKWRPNGNLATILSKLSIEHKHCNLHYESCKTFVPKFSPLIKNQITSYHSDLSELKFYVESPYRRYRLVFTGYMNESQNPNKQRFVKLNMLIIINSKVFDYNQNAKVPFNRNECFFQAKGCLSIYGQSIEISDEKFSTKLFLYGLKSRDFETKPIQVDQVNYTSAHRVLAYFKSGRAISCSVLVKTEDGKLSNTFGMYNKNAATNLPRELPFASLDWKNIVDQIEDIDKDSTVGVGVGDFKIKVSLDAKVMQSIVTTKRRKHSNIFNALFEDRLEGWIKLTINESIVDSEEEHKKLSESIDRYTTNICSGNIWSFNNNNNASTLNECNAETNETLETANKTAPLVVRIEDAEFARQDLVGAKAASLAQMHQLYKKLHATRGDKISVEIPKAIALTKHFYEYIKETNIDLTKLIASTTSKIYSTNISNEELEILCTSLQASILDERTILPQSIIEELINGLNREFNIFDVFGSFDNRAFAVRSSSWGEDEDGMSAAGQLTTVLNVRSLDKLLAAVKQCFASKFSATNIEYKRQHGLPLDMPMAVVVQEMIACEKAGVVFTCDPTTGNGRYMTVTANYGLGESVVSAAADPDSIIVSHAEPNDDRKYRIVRLHVGKKEVIINDDKHSSAQTNVDYDRSVCCMSDEEIFELAAHADELRFFFQSERDIEFGFKSGKLYLFQSRPVTGLDASIPFEIEHDVDSPAKAEWDYLSRANLGEVMPRAISEAGVTSFVASWDITDAKLLRRWSHFNAEEYAPWIKVHTCIHSHHLFFSLQTSKLFMTNSDGSLMDFSRALQISIFGREVDLPEVMKMTQECGGDVTKFESKFWFLLHNFSILIWPSAKLSCTRNRLEKIRTKIDSRSKNLLSAADWSKIESCNVILRQAYSQITADILQSMEPVWSDHIVMILTSSGTNMRLYLELKKLIYDSSELYSALAKILGCAHEILSAEIPKKIEEMSNVLKKRGVEEIQQFVALNSISKEALDYVKSEEKALKFNDNLPKLFAAFITKFGYRCFNEFDIRNKPWRDRPDELISQLQLNCKSAEIKTSECKSRQTLDEILDSLKVNKSMTNSVRKRIKNLSLKSHTFVRMRELGKDNLIYFVDILRSSYRTLGECLVRAGRIPDVDLVFFIKFAELEHIIENHQPTIVMEASRRRRIFVKSYEKIWHFDEIIIGPDIQPRHASASINADVINAPRLIGTPACAGKVTGIICVVEDFTQLHKVTQDCILVTPNTDIGFSPVFPMLTGLVTEAAGLISHGAVVAREYGLPTIIGVQNATKILKDGEKVLLDAENGCIVRVDHNINAQE